MSGVPARIAGIAVPDSALAVHARVRVSDGHLTLLSEGERLTGAHALGPETGEWLQKAVLAIRVRVSSLGPSAVATGGRGVPLVTSPANADAAGRPAAHPERLMPRSEVSQLR